MVFCFLQTSAGNRIAGAPPCFNHDDKGRGTLLVACFWEQRLKAESERQNGPSIGKRYPKGAFCDT